MRSAAAAVVLVVGLTGCSAGEPAPAVVEPLASGRSGVGESSPLPIATPSASPPVVVQGGGAQPTATADPRPQDASEFTLHFFDVVNGAYRTERPEAIRDLSTPKCGSCASVASDIERLVEKGHAVDGRRYIVTYAAAAPVRADGSVVVDFRFNADPYVERDRTGAIIQQFPADRDRDGQVLVSPRRSGWVVEAIRLVDQ